MIKVNKGQPEVEKFITMEQKTITFLGTYPSFKNNLKNLYAEAATKSLIFRSNRGKKKIKKIDFDFEFELLLENKLCIIVIEGLIEEEYKMSTYSVLIRDEDDNLIRKYHFDYAPHEKKKPLYHFQYCGKATPKTSKLSIDLEPIHPWMSLPRISNYPVNLALILDMILSQSTDVGVKKGIEKDGWRDLITENETFLIKDYFLNTAKYFANQHNSKRTYREYCYGE